MRCASGCASCDHRIALLHVAELYVYWQNLGEQLRFSFQYTLASRPVKAPQILNKPDCMGFPYICCEIAHIREKISFCASQVSGGRTPGRPVPVTE